ncbi:MAG: ABC transporter permease, partial [Bacteroidales bacterium]|nr:ABC transporter permease [Bacteroidales bacterium]
HLVPATSRAFGVNLDADFSGVSFWIQVTAIFLLTGLLAGLYPAVKIAGFKPLVFLSGKSVNNVHGGSRSRKILIVVQFTFSVIFILVSIFIIRQYSYLKEADLGFNREDVLYIRTKGRAWDQYPLIKRDLSELHFVKGVSSGSEVPVWIDRGEIEWGEREGEHNIIARILVTDPDFLSTLEIDLLEGEYFSDDRDTLNHDYVVVNQALVEVMGWKEPVGMPFYLWGRDFQILGVTENVNFFPFNMEVLGGNDALIYLYEDVREYIFVRVQPGISPEQIANIESVFQKYNPGYEFDHDFVSEYRYEMLESADGLNFIFKLFSFVAIFIAVMGLVGLSLFNNNRRTKEVGIRKVNGANTGIIMRLLLSEFIRLVAISNLIALPLAYLIMKKILQFFSYSIDLKISTFILVFILSIALSLITVCYHAFRTARSNPVNSLRYE